MDREHTDCLAEARERTLRAARWLRLLSFQTRPGAPFFLPGVSTYHDMFDPVASDEKRHTACKAMLPSVARQVDIERWKCEEARAVIPESDPYGLEWCTTHRGAALETLADLLREAIGLYEAADRKRDDRA